MAMFGRGVGIFNLPPFSGKAVLDISAFSLVQPLVDLCDLAYPGLTFEMLQPENLFVRPVKVKCDIRYLFIEPLYGVAPDPPRLLISTSKFCSQCGHWARTRLWPFSLMRR